jgi:hypothetical protein
VIAPRNSPWSAAGSMRALSSRPGGGVPKAAKGREDGDDLLL